MLFWLLYRMVLQSEIFFKFNRFFLLTGLFVAVFLPQITVYYPVEVVQAAAHSVSRPREIIVTEGEVLVSEGTSGLSFVQILYVCYGIVVCVLLATRLWGICRLLGIAIQNRRYKFSGRYRQVESKNIKMPFSFLGYIFLPTTGISDSQRRIILKHEEAHIKQHHWIDLWLADLLCVLYWFNPIVWLYKKAVYENHEFLADRAVLRECPVKEYQCSLLNSWLGTSIFRPAESYYYSNPEKRMKMMKKNNSQSLKKLSVLLVFPAVALFLWAFAEPKYVVVASPVVPPAVDSTGKEMLASRTTTVKPAGMMVLNFAKNDKHASFVLSEEELRKVDALQGELIKYAKENKLSGQLCKAFTIKEKGVKRDTCLFAGVGMLRGDTLLIEQTLELSNKMNIPTLKDVKGQSVKLFVPIDSDTKENEPSVIITSDSFDFEKK